MPPKQYLNYQAESIEGLLPAVDPRVIKKPYVLDGRNFVFDVKGPGTRFGSVYMSKAPLYGSELCASFRIGSNVFLLTDTAVLAHDLAAMSFYPLFVFENPVAADWPWSHAEVDEVHYFCRKGVGVIYYDADTGEWNTLDTPDVPIDPRYVTQCRGRLIVLGQFVYAWSEIDTGTNLEASNTTGAGFQGVSIIGGEPYVCLEANNAFIVYTSNGLVIAEFQPGLSPFRHRVLTRHDKPINPHCVIEIDAGVHVFLDRKGFRTTDGRKPENYQPLFGEYVSKTLLKSRNLTLPSVFRLQYAVDQQLLFLSVGTNTAPSTYDVAWALYRPSDKWGRFDRTHHSFIEVYLESSANQGFNFGFVDPNGTVHKLNEGTFVESTTLPAIGHFWLDDFDLDARINDGIAIFPSVATLVAFDERPFHPYGSNWYLYGEFNRFIQEEADPNDTETEFASAAWAFQSESVMEGSWTEFSVQNVEQETSALDGWVRIGPFRFSEMKFDDQLGLVTNLLIGTELVGELFSSEDWNNVGTIQTQEDWEDSTPDEDWGSGDADSASYDAILEGTNDCKVVFFPSNLELVREEGDSALYTCMVEALYHTVTISALEYPQSFALNALEISGTAGGRLTGV